MILVLVYVYVVVPPSAFKYQMWQEFCERFVHLVLCFFFFLLDLDARLLELFVMIKFLMCYFDLVSLSLSLSLLLILFLSLESTFLLGKALG